MSLKKLKEFIDLAKSEGVTSLKYESKDEKFSVSFGAEGSVVVQQPKAISAQAVATESPVIQASSSDGLHEITSPFVGTFYAQASPSDPAYVQVGSKVSKGQVLCILEAMKIMNEIESDVSGEIVEICVENESLVEFGQVLFKVRA